MTTISHRCVVSAQFTGMLGSYLPRCSFEPPAAQIPDLAGFVALQRLELSYNSVQSMEPLTRLDSTALHELYIANNALPKLEVQECAHALVGGTCMCDERVVHVCIAAIAGVAPSDGSAPVGAGL